MAQAFKRESNFQCSTLENDIQAMLYLDDEKTELISNLRNQIAVLTTPPPAPQDESGIAAMPR